MTLFYDPMCETPCRAGPAEKPSDKYYKAAQLADALSRELHYTVDEKQKAVLITDDGYEAAEDVLEVGPEEAHAKQCPRRCRNAE